MGAAELKKHPFFKGVDWESMAIKGVEPPFKPEITSTKDTRNIDRLFLREKPVDSPVVSRLTVQQKQQINFDQFTYQKDNAMVDAFEIVDVLD